nr:hypothetical protein FFPRI1PSEUD_35500 [Pseudomonas sp. FFPRI_1]
MPAAFDESLSGAVSLGMNTLPRALVPSAEQALNWQAHSDQWPTSLLVLDDAQLLGHEQFIALDNLFNDLTVRAKAEVGQ